LSEKLSKRKVQVVGRSRELSFRARCRKRVVSIATLLGFIILAIILISMRRRHACEKCLSTKGLSTVWRFLFKKKSKEKYRYVTNITLLMLRRKGLRPNIRTMNATAVSKIVAALWILRKTKGHAGRKLYGPQFRSYNELVSSHADDARRFGKCLPLHASGAMFFMYHRLLLREAEASVRAVLDEPNFLFPTWIPTNADDSLTPQQGRKHIDPKLAVLFGAVPGNKDKDYAVDNGAFRKWPITRRDGEVSTKYHNLQKLPATVIRFESFCDQILNITLATRYKRCTQIYDIDTFLNEAYELHADWHRIIGGAVRCGPETRVPGDFENARTAVNDPVFFFIHAAFDDLLDTFLHRNDIKETPPPTNHSRNADIDHLWRNLRHAIDLCIRQGDFLHHRFRPFFFDYAHFSTLFLPSPTTYHESQSSTSTALPLSSPSNHAKTGGTNLHASAVASTTKPQGAQSSSKRRSGGFQQKSSSSSSTNFSSVLSPRRRRSSRSLSALYQS